MYYPIRWRIEGWKCELASAGRTKSNGFRKKRVVLSLLVNSAGYPFAWDILEDYTADVKTIKDLSIKWKTEFKFNDNEIVLVFDRGMVSDENLKHLELEKYKYITALDKNQIEQAFKDVKSFIKIQPFNVWTPKHVRAHYTICVLSYLLDITIANRLKEVDIGVRSTQKVYEVLKEGIIGKITVGSTGDEFLKLMSLQSQQKAILELFQSENVVRRGYLKSMGIK